MFPSVFFQISIKHATWVAASCFERTFNARFMFLPWPCLPSATFPSRPSSSYESPGKTPWGLCWCYPVEAVSWTNIFYHSGLHDSNILNKFDTYPLGAGGNTMSLWRVCRIYSILASTGEAFGNLTITIHLNLRGFLSTINGTVYPSRQTPPTGTSKSPMTTDSGIESKTCQMAILPQRVLNSNPRKHREYP